MAQATAKALPQPQRHWPPDYVAEFGVRQQRLLNIRKSPEMLAGALEYYATRPVEFINHWCLTYDPRNAGGDRPAHMPFILFERQEDLVEFLLAMINGQENGLIEKCRDMGATWVACAFSVWLWRFWPGAAVGWGSRKEQLVDHIGDPDSIFEKIRMIILGLPRELWPKGFRPRDHMSFMRIVNPDNGASITGEAGDNIGRGGRKLIYFKDESAHYPRPELIEAALGDNTRVQIDISSVNGPGNVFHRRREAGREWWPGQPAHKGRANIFVMDWSDHPDKDQAWYDARKAKAKTDGLMHVFAQEVDRNYYAANIGVVIPAEWVAAAVDAHLKIPAMLTGRVGAALDVSDGGLDRNALALRKGSVLTDIEEFVEEDTGATTRSVVNIIRKLGEVEIEYDCIGVGSGVKAEVNRLKEDKLLPEGLTWKPWNAGEAPLHPKEHVIPGDRETPLNKDYYQNLKAQGWWQLRRRFENTYRALNEGITFAPEDMISLDGRLRLLKQLKKELSQPTAGKSTNLRMLINKTPEGTRSPNLADAVMMVFWPMPGLGVFETAPLRM